MLVGVVALLDNFRSFCGVANAFDLAVEDLLLHACDGFVVYHVIARDFDAHWLIVLVYVAKRPFSAVSEARVNCAFAVGIVLRLNPFSVNHAVGAVFGIIVSKPLVDLLAVDLVMEIVCLFCSEAMPLRCMELLLDVHLIHSIIGSSTGFFLPYNLCNILRH